MGEPSQTARTGGVLRLISAVHPACERFPPIWIYRDIIEGRHTYFGVAGGWSEPER